MNLTVDAAKNNTPFIEQSGRLDMRAGVSIIASRPRRADSEDFCAPTSVRPTPSS
ncbi:hypothetical protein ACFFYR_19025 [Paraburkholderia dipogonis]|uniref:hypothetical protein n=1 Tax=Paraburkholderia dipogonis TaxID=1211383 RepID=UPI0035EEED35